MLADSVPVFIICRDQVTWLASLVTWLERAGHDRIVLIDNASTHPPLLDYFTESSHTVVRLETNLGPRALWEMEILETYAAGEWYVVSDPDVVPIEDCRLDAVARFRQILNRYPDYLKAGFGLRVDDLPSQYRHAAAVRTHEQNSWHRPFGKRLYDAAIDTTFALYRPYQRGFVFRTTPSIRTGRPYLARHMPWYADSANPTVEELYYSEHASTEINNWAKADLGDSLGPPRPWSPYLALRWRAHAALRMRRAPRRPRP